MRLTTPPQESGETYPAGGCSPCTPGWYSARLALYVTPEPTGADECEHLLAAGTGGTTPGNQFPACLTLTAGIKRITSCSTPPRPRRSCSSAVAAQGA